MVKIIGLITARGGSKGVPGKNIKELVGKPLIAWTIESALNSRVCSKLIVSSDDNEILNVAREWGAEVPFIRPPHLAGDKTTSIEVIFHAIEYLQDEGFKESDYILLLQPTSPLRTVDDIKNAINIAKLKQADAVVSVIDAPSHPFMVKKINPDGILNSFFKNDFNNGRRQDLPSAYALNGAIYLNKISSLLKEKTFLPENKTYAYLMPPERSIDIDTLWDFHLSKLIIEDRIKAKY